MSGTVDFYSTPLVVIFLAGLVLNVATSEAGWRLGLRRGAPGGGNITTLESAMIGLLALLIGFTFSMALSRFEARRDAVVQEANAIGTTALRARTLPEPQRGESLKLLREYVQLRLDVVQQDRSFADAAQAVERANRIQEALWQHAKAVTATDKSVITGLYLQTLNQMIDQQGVRLAALRNRIPNIVLMTLYLLAAAACGFAGYASALDAQRARLPVYAVAVLVSAVLYLIIDIDRPNSGFITNNHQAMIDLASSIAAFSD
jgi:hypothetical protein